jgi:hypothetical protein
MHKRPHVEYPLHLSDFNLTLPFAVDFQKEILKYQISRKSVPRETRCPTPEDTQTEMILTMVLQKFFNAPKTNTSIYVYARFG